MAPAITAAGLKGGKLGEGCSSNAAQSFMFACVLAGGAVGYWGHTASEESPVVGYAAVMASIVIIVGW